MRAVGFNPEAARYGGISVARNYFLAMAISGAFAGLAGAMDILGWQFRLATQRHPGLADRLHRDRRRAARAQHARSASSLSALLFGALVTGTSTRQPRPDVFEPELASNLTLIIQGLVVLFVGADVLVLYLWTAAQEAAAADAQASRSR